MLSKEALELLIQSLQKTDTPKAIELPRNRTGLLVPQGFRIAEFAPDDEPMTHIGECVLVHDKASMIAYVNDFKTPVSRMFAEPGFMADMRRHPPQARIVAVLDYHGPSAPAPTSDEENPDASAGVLPGIPNFARHAVLYEPRYSEEWRRWCSVSEKDKWLSQVEFAELIEECRTDITEPFAAELLDMVTKFRATKKVEFNSMTYQADGSALLHYSEDVQLADKMVMPAKIKLVIPVFYRGTKFEVDVFVRFRVGGGVRFQLKIDRPDRMEEAAFEELSNAVFKGTSVPMHLGRLPDLTPGRRNSHPADDSPAYPPGTRR